MKTFERLTIMFCCMVMAVSMAAAATTIAWAFYKIGKLIPGGAS